jgi:hypothetical protein
MTYEGAEISISYHEDLWTLRLSTLEFRGDRISRGSIYLTGSWEPPEWWALWLWAERDIRYLLTA